MALQTRIPRVPALLATALLVRLGMLFWYLSTHGWQPETWEYEVIALNLLEKGEFVFPHHGVEYRSYVVPVFPLICYLLHLIGGQGLWLYVFFHISVSLATVWLTYWLSSRWFGPQAALWAALLVSLEPGLIIYQSYKVDVIAISMCWLLLGLALFDRVVSSGGIRWTILLGVLTGIAVLTRPDLIAILAPFIVWMMIRGQQDRKVWGHLLIALAIATLLVTPWLIRNYTWHGRLVLTTIAAENLWIGNYERATPGTPEGGTYLDFVPPSIRAALASGTELEQSDAFLNDVLRSISANPFGFLERAARKFAYFWWFTPTSGMLYRDISPVFREGYKALYGVLLILFLTGVWATIRESDSQRFLRAMAALAVVAVVVAIHTIYYVEGRHRVLVMPILLMFSGYGLQNLVDSLRLVRQRLVHQ